MSDQSPEPGERKQALVAPFIIGGVVILLLVLALFPHGAKNPAPPPVDEKSSGAPVAATPLPPAAPKALTRRDFIERAAVAAGAYSDSQGAAPLMPDLNGRTFLLRIPFGCEESQSVSGTAQAAVEYQAAKGALKLSARPADWTHSPMLSYMELAPDIEKVEGFWLPRPWSYSETCPTPRKELSILGLPSAIENTLGVAQIFKKDGSRLLRRDGRPYEFVRKIPKDEPEDLSRPYYLVLEGRVAEFENGVSIKCHSANLEERPVCLYAVEFERVAFENADGDTLAEWRK